MNNFIGNNKALITLLEILKEETTEEQYKIIEVLIKSAYHTGGMDSIRELNSKLGIKIK